MTRQHLFIILSVLVLPSAASSQTITQRLQQRVAGQGVVNIYQNDSVRQVVDGKPIVKPATKVDKAADKPVADKASKPAAKDDGKQGGQRKDNKDDKQQAVAQEPQAAPDSIPALNRNALRGGRKMKGFRVQAYAGGNSRRDHNLAEQIKNRVKEALPYEPVYVHFISPRWTCRVGNYRTYAEAQTVLQQIRELGIEGANIVKTQITVKSEE